MLTDEQQLLVLEDWHREHDGGSPSPPRRAALADEVATMPIYLQQFGPIRRLT